MPGRNQVDAAGQRSRQKIARDVARFHIHGLEARRQRDLLSEKFLLHIDGSGDLQWADILYGRKVEIPRMVSDFRKTENLLRPIVDNAIAHHTTLPLRFIADAPPDRKARETAIMDTVWANHVAQTQDWNGLFTEALYLAMPAGFCPVHAYWRDDLVVDHEPMPEDPNDPDKVLKRLADPRPGVLDCWVGNPFDTVFDRAAKRNSIYACTYGRVLPAKAVRAAFDHIEGVRGLQGSTKIPSAAIFQRIAKDWLLGDLEVHGTAVTAYRRGGIGDEELMVLVCQEILPGWDPDFPDGRLRLVALPGAVDLRRHEANTANAFLLVDQPLPAGQFSFTNFYSHSRSEDVHGKPWVEDLDQLQVDLNIARSKRWEHVNRMMEAPIVGPGGAVSDDMLDFGAFQYMELEPSVANWRPQVMAWPQQIITAVDREIDDIRKAMFTIGGYQAVSRGESPGTRMAYRAIVALQQADKTIHSPVNQRFQRSACDFARKCWWQMKTYGDVAWLVQVAGDEYQHLAEPYIDNSKLSDVPPNYKLVDAFGPSPELRAQEVLELVRMKGADGEPLLRTEEARRQYPNSTLFSNDSQPNAVRRRRARTVATMAHNLARRFRAETGFSEVDPANPQVKDAAMWVFMNLEKRFPRLRDDDLMAHLDSYTETIQDETADPIARYALMRRQDLYYKWQADMAAAAVAGPALAPAGGRPAGKKPLRRPAVRAIAAEAHSSRPVEAPSPREGVVGE